MWSLGAPGGRFPGGRRIGLGLGQSFAQLTSLVQNLMRGAGEGGGGRVGWVPRGWDHSQARIGTIL